MHVRGLQKFGSVVTEVLKTSGTNGTADAASADQASDALSTVLEVTQLCGLARSRSYNGWRGFGCDGFKLLECRAMFVLHRSWQ